MKATLTGGAALRIVKNEKLLCANCLSSGEGPDPNAVYCFLMPDPTVKGKEQFCTQGSWLINGEVCTFREGFQALYKDNQEMIGDKEIKI